MKFNFGFVPVGVVALIILTGIVLALRENGWI